MTGAEVAKMTKDELVDLVGRTKRSLAGAKNKMAKDMNAGVAFLMAGAAAAVIVQRWMDKQENIPDWAKKYGVPALAVLLYIKGKKAEYRMFALGVAAVYIGKMVAEADIGLGAVATYPTALPRGTRAGAVATYPRLPRRVAAFVTDGGRMATGTGLPMRRVAGITFRG